MPRDNTVPSNYTAIPVKDVKKTSLPPARDRYAPGQLTVHIALELEVLGMGLHVGAGTPDLLDGKLFLEVLTRKDGGFCIPGSSIKGAVRQIHEVLTDSCEGDDARIRLGDRTSASVALFGFLGYQGRVCFEEFLPGPDGCDFGLVRIPAGFQPSRAKGRRFYGGFPAGAPQQVAYGVLPKGSRLRGGVTIELSSEREVGLLLLALGLDGSFSPKIGGGKHGGLGAVRFHVRSVKMLEPASRYGGGESHAVDEAASWAANLARNATSHLSESGKKALERLREHMAGELTR